MIRIIRNLLLGAIIGGAVPAAKADVVFESRFDAPYYAEGVPVPLGAGIMPGGQWHRVPKAARPGHVLQLDGEPVLELKATPSFSAGSRAIVGFTNDAGESAPVADGLKVSVQLMMSDLFDSTFYLQVMGSDGKSKGTLGMSDAAVFTVSFGGDRVELGQPMEPGRWYWVEFLMPREPGTKSKYSVRLYDGDHQTLIDSKSGVMARSVEPDGHAYTGVDLQHRVTTGFLYIKTIQIHREP